MPARLRLIVILAALLLAGACSSATETTMVLRTHTASLEPAQVTIASINVVSSTVGPIVVGLVRNVTTTSVGGVQVVATLGTASGSPLGRPSFASTLLHVVPPGGEAAFTITFDGAHATAGSVSATVQDEPSVPVPFVTMTVASSSGIDLAAGYEVTGTVLNSSSAPVEFPNVVATFYDHAGNVVGAASGTGTAATVAPGGSTPFDIYLLGSGKLVARYALAAEGQVVTPGH